MISENNRFLPDLSRQGYNQTETTITLQSCHYQGDSCHDDR